eukprot:Protomagalhaensia_sp_Gyna_25__2917@NODE_2707_length_933_cov_2042_808725_g2257_i0_p1_GENE_NODE_2707_length_933_cov_2042_808725_g2257_i0NODE_2707_length_933_cov_2042_808725_g2257_i0_p1_ORF_typecomplete_len212_score44_31GST_N/PF02798_20/1_3e13GST_N_3/PF13417_6/1_1e07GST_C_3/PF14497_6/0_00022Tom37/PF10568_9/0_016GST_N_4/PF17172_4/0_12_NODE_2707_length_933_cov_2042_808725_g2257_i0194829
MTSVSSKPILYYFDVAGRAEPIRCAFAAAGIDFEDKRLTKEEWDEQKAAGLSPSGQLPLLEMDGKKFVESRAILTYVCALTGNIPTTPMEILNHNMLLDSIDSMWGLFRPLYTAKKKKEKANAVQEVTVNVKQYLKKLDGQVKDHTGEPSHVLKGKPYCPTDLTLYACAREFPKRPYGIDIGNIEQEYPAIYSIYKGVLESNPRIKAYHSA